MVQKSNNMPEYHRYFSITDALPMLKFSLWLARLLSEIECDEWLVAYKKPSGREIEARRPWLLSELELVKPSLA